MRAGIIAALNNADKRLAFEPHYGCDKCVAKLNHTVQEHTDNIKRYLLSTDSIPEWNQIFNDGGSNEQ